MLTIVKDLLSECNMEMLENASVSSGVHKSNLRSWKSGRNSPRLDLFIAVANTMGYDVKLKKEFKLVTRTETIDVMFGNKRIGYGDVSNGQLFAMNAQDFAVDIGFYNHKSEIIAKVTEWRRRNITA